MGVWLLIAAAGLAATGECEDRTAVIEQAEQAVLELRFDDAEALLGRAEAAFACGSIAEVETLARFWLAEGVMLTLVGDTVSAEDSFAAAGRIAPDYWNEVYGPSFEEAHHRARDVTRESGEIRLQPDPEGQLTLLDGEYTTFPTSVESGLHLIQVGRADDFMQFGRVVFLPGGQDLTVPVELVADPGTPSDPDPDPVVPEVTPGQTVEPPQRFVRPERPELERKTRVTLALRAGFGGTGQNPDQPGTWLAQELVSGPAGSLTSYGVLTLAGPLGAWWDLSAPLHTKGLFTDLYGGPSVQAGSLGVRPGVGATTVRVVEGDQDRQVWLVQPRLEVGYLLDVFLPIRLSAGGGWVPSSNHAQFRATVSGKTTLRWSAGLAVTGVNARFVQQGTGGREVRISRWQTAAEFGLTWGP